MTKLFMSALLSLSLLFSFSFGGDWWERNKEWVVGQGIFLTLLAIDWGQTRYIAKLGLPELNPILGKKPSLRKINAYFITVAILHTYLSWEGWKYNKRQWRWFIGISIGIELNQTFNNWAGGIEIYF